MIKNAKLYEEEIKRKFWEIDYDPYYQYYYGSVWRSNFSLDNEYRRDFVILNGKGEIIGLIGYGFNMDNKVADKFGLIHFGAKDKKGLDTDSFTVSHGLYRVIDDIFCKFGMNYLEFSVIKGNPIQASYEKLVNKIGGRILCQRKNRAMLLDGSLADDITYEISKAQYFSYKEKIKTLVQKVDSKANQVIEDKDLYTYTKEDVDEEMQYAMKYPILDISSLKEKDTIKVLEILPVGYIVEYNNVCYYYSERHKTGNLFKDWKGIDSWN